MNKNQVFAQKMAVQTVQTGLVNICSVSKFFGKFYHILDVKTETFSDYCTHKSPNYKIDNTNTENHNFLFGYTSLWGKKGY